MGNGNGNPKQDAQHNQGQNASQAGSICSQTCNGQNPQNNTPNFGKGSNQGTVAAATSNPCNLNAHGGPGEIRNSANRPVGSMDFRWGEQNGPSLGFASTSGRTQSFNDDSVNLANGNLVKGYTVLDFPTKCVPLRIYPFYNAQDTYRGPFGFGWSFAYDTHLTDVNGWIILARFGLIILAHSPLPIVSEALLL